MRIFAGLCFIAPIIATDSAEYAVDKDGWKIFPGDSDSPGEISDHESSSLLDPPSVVDAKSTCVFLKAQVRESLQERALMFSIRKKWRVIPFFRIRFYDGVFKDDVKRFLHTVDDVDCPTEIATLGPLEVVVAAIPKIVDEKDPNSSILALEVVALMKLFVLRPFVDKSLGEDYARLEEAINVSIAQIDLLVSGGRGHYRRFFGIREAWDRTKKIPAWGQMITDQVLLIALEPDDADPAETTPLHVSLQEARNMVSTMARDNLLPLDSVKFENFLAWFRTRAHSALALEVHADSVEAAIAEVGIKNESKKKSVGVYERKHKKLDSVGQVLRYHARKMWPL